MSEIVALITDLHFGARGNSIEFDNHFKKFYQEKFFPELENRNVRQVICLGDMFDVRKNINADILSSCKEYFFDELKRRNIELHTIVGNHDAYFKDTLSVNTPDLVLREYTNVHVISSPKQIGNILMVPWICRDNAELSMKMLEESKAKFCFGHFEIEGFSMYKGVQSHGGFKAEIFKKFQKVFSGHYHTRSTQKNITYLGTCYEITWSDYDDPKGFHLFDVDTGNLEFIQNPHNIFCRFDYTDETKEQPDFKDKIVRIVTKNVTDKTKFDKFIKRAQDTNPYELKIVDQQAILKVEEIDEEIQVDDTGKVLSNYIDSIEDSLKEQKLDPNMLKSILLDTYKEASDNDNI
jgi:DNA repair exonuclease SbcCD nuclease subunit